MNDAKQPQERICAKCGCRDWGICHQPKRVGDGAPDIERHKFVAGEAAQPEEFSFDARYSGADAKKWWWENVKVTPFKMTPERIWGHMQRYAESKALAVSTPPAASAPVHRTNRISCHIAPDQNDIERNKMEESEGERIRAELIDWLNRNKIVTVCLDTEEHCVSIDITKLPPEIKPVLTLWGSIYVRNDEAAALSPAQAAQDEPVSDADFNALAYEICKLYAAVTGDEDWKDADISNMEEFDPWDALRQLGNGYVSGQYFPATEPAAQAVAQIEAAIEHRKTCTHSVITMQPFCMSCGECGTGLTGQSGNMAAQAVAGEPQQDNNMQTDLKSETIMQPIIAYHGTSTIDARDSILNEGFRVGTYFAYRLRDALAHGGKYIFEAEFDSSGFKGEPDGWQFHLREAIPANKIQACYQVESAAPEPVAEPAIKFLEKIRQLSSSLYEGKGESHYLTRLTAIRCAVDAEIAALEKGRVRE